MSSAQRNNEITEVGNSERTTRKFRVSRVIVAKRVIKKKPKLQSCVCPLTLHHNLASFTGEQPLISSTRHHLVFLFLIPLLIGLLQVHYQSKTVSPFDTHPVTMWVFLTTTCIYCLGLTTSLELQNHKASYTQMVSHIILSSGALASVSLASVFFPRLIGWLFLCLWTVLPVAFSRHLVKHIYKWLQHRINEAISLARDRFNRFWGCLTLKRQHLPK